MLPRGIQHLMFDQMKIGNGFKTRLEFVLEQVFEGRSCGGDHPTRAFVATRLLEAAQRGILKLEDLNGVAQDALDELLHPPASVPAPIEPDLRSRHV